MAMAGGILVLCREACPCFGSGVRVQIDARSGIVWVHADEHFLAVAFVYSSPSNSALNRNGVLNQGFLHTCVDALAQAKVRGHDFPCRGDFNIRTGCMDDDARGPGI